MISIRFRLATLAFLMGSPAFAADTVVETPAPADVSALIEEARASIDDEYYGAAIAKLQEALVASPENADILNLLGYASRKSGDLDRAAEFYQAALAINPDHLGALEYQGELFIMLGDMAAAEANLARLADLCGACEEHADLAEALAGS
jgi:Flp pilus assembly protein TadD